MQSRHDVPARIALLASAAVLLLACARESPKTADSELVVARLNGTPITLQELKEEMASRRGLSLSVAAQGTAPEVSSALRLLLERTAVVQEGVRLGVTVSESEVEEEVRQYRSDFPAGGLEKSLLQQGIGMGEWRARMRRSLFYRKSTEAIGARFAEVTEEEVRESFRGQAVRPGRPERIRVRQIIFDSAKEALEARGRMAGGDPPDKAVLQGGGSGPAPAVVDLGYLSRDDLPPEVAGEIFDLPPGGVSGVVRREKSYSLFRVDERQGAREGPFEEAAPRIREELLRGKREEKFREWLEGEMAKADIEIQAHLLERIGEKRR